MRITDVLNRPLRDVRMSVIDQCNLRCTYCMPAETFGADFAFLPEKELLTFDEMTRLASIFASLGVKKIRITGGEPLLRKELPSLIARLLKIEGIDDVSLTTNGILLGKYAEPLKQAGLKRVNVSLDSLSDEVYGKMNGRGFPVKRVLQSIEKAASTGLQIKINMVVQRGVNEQEIVPMADYCFKKCYTLRFIEYMDVGSTNGWEPGHVYPSRKIRDAIQAKRSLEVVEPSYKGEVAKRYRYSGTNTEIGFISSVTEAFCSTCNRARVSADGKLYTCLFASKGTDLCALLRSDASDEELASFMIENWNKRNDRYSEQRMELRGQKTIEKIEMSYIGG
ncbi:MAG: GTP 3',8-cyclase MoaA [Bacillus sp. (in: firmicutes)]